MSFEIEFGDPLRIAFSGVIRRQHLTEGLVALADVGYSRGSSRPIIDLRAVTRLELRVADSHEVSRTNRSLLDEGPHLRVAVIAEGAVRDDAERHYLVRDNLTGASPLATGPDRDRGDARGRPRMVRRAGRSGARSRSQPSRSVRTRRASAKKLNVA